jgi:tRNA pseudouridine38-40 synthase
MSWLEKYYKIANFVPMFNYKLTIQYDGTDYAGWQIQENALTVQEVISNSIKQILQEEISLVGSGRTDAGVHALGQVANFKLSRKLDLFKFKYSLNSVLPYDISVLDIEIVDENFHSRFSARNRSYLYLISNQKSPFFNRYSYTYFSDVNAEELTKLSSTLIGVRDFTSLSKTNPDVQNRMCNVYQARWRRQKNLLIFYIEANRFLYGMVRAIVGSLLKAYSSENGINYLKNILEQKDRNCASDAAPARGLFLYKVKY